MRKLALVATLVVLLVPFFAAASFARNQVIRCAGIPCMGTGNGDLIYERAGNRLNDKIYLKGAATRFAPTATHATETSSTAARATT